MNRYLGLIKAALCVAVLLQTCGGGTVVPFTTPTDTAAPTITSTITLFDVIGGARLSDTSFGLVRFSGDVHDWPANISVPSGDANATLAGLRLTITTGHDDLRGGNDNADVIVHYASAGDVTSTNINQGQEWNNGTTHTVSLTPLPAGAILGYIQTFTLETDFTGGLDGENWDVTRITLVATIQK